MMLEFRENPQPTIGVEVEMQLIDPVTLQLTPGIEELKRRTPAEMGASVKPELMQSYVEINTGICHTVADVRRDLGEKMRALCHAAYAAGLSVIWAGTHPMSLWDTQTVTDDDRYHRIIDQLQYVARRLVTFGVHVHVGLPDGERAIDVMNSIVQYVPHLIALSANSPFWYGKPSGLQSTRIKVLEALPRGGLPPALGGWTDFQRLFETLIEAGAVESIKEMWWDIRPHPDFGTLEVRVFDTPLTFDEIVSVAALVQALVVRAMRDRRAGPRPSPVQSTVIAQNKWWATRYGLDADFIDYASGGKIGARAAIMRLLDGLADTASDLGSLAELARIAHVLERGTGASLQLRVFERSGDAREVVRFLLRQNVCGGAGGGDCPVRTLLEAPSPARCAFCDLPHKTL